MNRLSLRWFDYLFLTGFCLLLFGFASLYERTLNPHETVHCVNVREMLAGDDWLIPTYGGWPWLERPPLPHWITAIVAAPFGAGEQVWTYRLSSHLAGTACVLLTAWMASLWYGRWLGILAGAVLATMFEFYVYSTLTECDVSLCLVITIAMALFVRVEFGGRGSTWDGTCSVRDATSGSGSLPGHTPSSLNETSSVLHAEDLRFFGKRPLALAAFFFFFGLTNIAKGLFFGTLFVGVAVGGYLLGGFLGRRERADSNGTSSVLHADAAADASVSPSRTLRRYIWFWGWLIFFVTASFWAFFAYGRHPDIVDLWHSDYVGRLSLGFIREPAWYYFVQLPLVTAPWFPGALLGLALTARAALRPQSPERFLWCWAWLPVLFFSIPMGKHHHYLLHGLAPWAVLGALGARQAWTWLTQAPRWVRRPLLPVVLLGLGGDALIYACRGRIAGAEQILPGLLLSWPALVFLFWWGASQSRPGIAFACVFGSFFIVHAFIWAYRGDHLTRYRDDLAFIARARQTVPADSTIYVKRDSHPLNGSWLLFYLGERSALLHNLTFLRDSDIDVRTVYVVGRLMDAEALGEYGRAEIIDFSAQTRGQTCDADRFALFRLTYRHDLARLPASNVHVSACQATGRDKGPYLE